MLCCVPRLCRLLKRHFKGAYGSWSSPSVAHIHEQSLCCRDFHASDYDTLSALDEGAPARPRRCLSEAALKSIPSHIHPERPPLGVARPAPGAAGMVTSAPCAYLQLTRICAQHFSSLAVMRSS